MTDELDYGDTDALTDASSEIDSYDYRDENDDDDRVSLILYQAPDGRYFRYVADVGMNSPWEGSLGKVKWFGTALPEDWKEE